MPRAKRIKTEVTQKLVGFYVTPAEKVLIERVKSRDQSMSEFCRDLIMPVVIRRLVGKSADRVENVERLENLLSAGNQGTVRLGESVVNSY